MWSKVLGNFKYMIFQMHNKAFPLWISSALSFSAGWNIQNSALVLYLNSQRNSISHELWISMKWVFPEPKKTVEGYWIYKRRDSRQCYGCKDPGSRNYFSVVRSCVLYNYKHRVNKQEAWKSSRLLGKVLCRNHGSGIYQRLKKPGTLTSWLTEKTMHEKEIPFKKV